MRSSLSLSLTLCASLLGAVVPVPRPAVAAGRVQLAARGADLHGVARLVAEACHDNVVISGAVNGSLTLGAKLRSPRAALHAVAARGGGTVQRHGNVDVILLRGRAPQTVKRYRKLRAGRKPLAGRARRLTLDFQRARPANLLRLIGQVSGLELEGAAAVPGTVSVRVLNMRWDRVLELILLAQGYGVRPGAGARWVVAPLTQPPPAKSARSAPLRQADRPAAEAPPETPGAPYVPPLRRHPAASFRLTAVVRAAGRARALLHRAGDDQDYIVRRGQAVGREALRVNAIALDGITLRPAPRGHGETGERERGDRAEAAAVEVKLGEPLQ